MSVPQDSDLAAVETLLKDAEKAVRLPRIKITPAGDDTPGLVTVSRESMDPTAETLLKEARQDRPGRQDDQENDPQAGTGRVAASH